MEFFFKHLKFAEFFTELVKFLKIFTFIFPFLLIKAAKKITQIFIFLIF